MFLWLSRALLGNSSSATYLPTSEGTSLSMESSPDKRLHDALHVMRHPHGRARAQRRLALGVRRTHGVSVGGEAALACQHTSGEPLLFLVFLRHPWRRTANAMARRH
eukprot:TRINITY_DN15116_c0_g1_i2.p2 TRINITY_DN15116_c0_g1~~TRINITY_DN15116_c0_g1_i2.p2  ORF type:complete len:107 (-),score=13.53 TRINITY_DN15116_c0_g1_i2:39-359(-)